MAVPPPRTSLAQFLALNRTVAVVLLSVLFFGLGEQLWSQFMPVFLDAQTKQGARESSHVGKVSWLLLATVGVYACLRNFFEGFCYIGGGQLTGRLGDRGSLLLFGVFTIVGYVLFLVSPLPVLTILAALLIMGWEPLSVPVTFTTVGSTVTASGQGMAFALQSIQKRLPKIIGPALAGFVLGFAERVLADEVEGRIVGMRILVGVSLGLALMSLALQWRFMPHREPERSDVRATVIVRQLHPVLKRLLLAEIFTRWCDWLVREFILLYLVLECGVSLAWAGMLFAIQNFTALLTYLPIGRLTKRAGLRPFVGLTFIFFALFPLVLALVPPDLLVVAFIVYGLREIGEPARKALITSLLPPEIRARGVGLYWGLRSFAVCTASLVGAVLWFRFGPRVMLLTAATLGGIGAGVYYFLCPTETPPGDKS